MLYTVQPHRVACMASLTVYYPVVWVGAAVDEQRQVQKRILLSGSIGCSQRLFLTLIHVCVKHRFNVERPNAVQADSL